MIISSILYMLFRIFMYYLGVLIIICLMGCSSFVYDKKDKRISDSYFFKKIWELPLNYKSKKYGSSSINFNLFCQNSEIFVVSQHGLIKKIDCDNGRILWSIDLSFFIKSKLYNFPSLFFGNVITVDNKIFICSEYAEIYAICVNTGSVIWKTKLANEILSLPSITIDGVVLVYSDSGVLRGLNECDGSIKWTLNFDTPLFTLKNKCISTVSSCGILLFGDDLGLVNVVSVDHGKLLWKRRIVELDSGCNRIISRFNGAKIFTTDIDNVVCIQNYDSTSVAILNVCSDSINLLYGIGTIKYTISSNNILCIIDQNNRLISIDLLTGKILWKQIILSNRNLTRPGLYNNCIVLGDNKGYLYLINMKNGYLVYQKKIIPFGILSAPIIIDNKLFIQSVNSIIYSFYIFV